jgi:methyl-accepting chemotaxis protein
MKKGLHTKLVGMRDELKKIGSDLAKFRDKLEDLLEETKDDIEMTEEAEQALDAVVQRISETH